MNIQFTTSVADAAVARVDVLAVPVTRTLDLAGVPAGWRTALKKRLTERRFTGEWGSTLFLVEPVPEGPMFLALVGLGAPDGEGQYQAEGWRRGVAQVVRDAQQHGLRTLGVNVGAGTAAPQLAAAAVEAVLLTRYSFHQYSERLKVAATRGRLQRVTLLTSRGRQAEVKTAIDRAQHVLAGVDLARDLVNQPAGHMSPRTLVKVARELAAASPVLSVKILNRQQAKRAGFTAFLAVAQGSQEEPYVIHLTYKPRARAATRVALVGKGVTFDSGGLSLKPAEFMEYMKVDMAGAAAVLGVFAALAKLTPAVEVHGIIAACENMPSGNAYRPGDVLTAKNGKTIEVLNTDAEGRITLADALTYAIEQKPTVVIDIATLTGACMVALGETVAGLWSTNTDLEQRIHAASGRTGEGVATLPMPVEYMKQIEGTIADLRNIGTSRYGGAVTAAMFLREFVEETPWAHIDIAGPAYMERPLLPYYGLGGTGYGVRLLTDVVEHFTQ